MEMTFFRNQLSETGKFCSGEKVRVYDAKGHFIGIYRYMEDKKNVPPCKNVP